MILASIFLFAAAAGTAYWLIARRENDAAAKRPQREAKAGGRFGAVAIRIRRGACRAARELGDRRFLAKDAPALPLPQCTAVQCSCSFTKLSDRRTESRRLEHGGLSATLFLNKNRRQERDRRRAAKTLGAR